MCFMFDMPIQGVNSTISSNEIPIRVGLCHPQYEEARIILAILNDPRFANLDEMILSIEKNDQGYLITTDSFTMQVDVKAVLPPRNHPMCGHRQFELVFHDPVRLSNGLQALHPKYQTAREIVAILRDPTLFEKLGNDFVREIRKTEDGYMIATSSSSEIRVDVLYYTPTKIGDPDCFNLFFHDRTTN